MTKPTFVTYLFAQVSFLLTFRQHQVDTLEQTLITNKLLHILPTKHVTAKTKAKRFCGR